MSLNEGHEIVMLDALVGGADGVVERQEARGQAALVHSDLIPVSRHDEDAAWEALGFCFGEVVESDPIFQRVTLPTGWTRKGSSHAMWSHIYDAEGFKRIAIFYKAAFYDRSANASITRVPETDAQSETLNRLADDLPPYEMGEANWRQHSRNSLPEGGPIVALYSKETIKPYPAENTVHASRVVVIAPDGSITSDTTEETAVAAT